MPDEQLGSTDVVTFSQPGAAGWTFPKSIVVAMSAARSA